MEKVINKIQQQELFDESANRWRALPVVSCKDVEQLLIQLFIQAIHKSSAMQKTEETHASKN